MSKVYTEEKHSEKIRSLDTMRFYVGTFGTKSFCLFFNKKGVLFPQTISKVQCYLGSAVNF